MRNIRLLSYCALIAACFSNFSAQAQVISTVAGGGAGGGMGGPAENVTATASTLATPYGIVKDNTGNLYIADEANALIRKVDASGIITAVAGNPGFAFADAGDGGLATAAACVLVLPADVGVDNAGNIYIAEASLGFGPGGGSRVRMVNSSTGIITTIAGGGTVTTAPYGDGGPATAATFTGATGIVVDPSGSPIYVSDGGHNRVRVLTQSTPGSGPYTINNYVAYKFGKGLLRIKVEGEVWDLIP